MEAHFHLVVITLATPAKKTPVIGPHLAIAVSLRPAATKATFLLFLHLAKLSFSSFTNYQSLSLAVLADLDREMPTQSTLTKDERNKVKSTNSPHKTLYASLGRLYYAYPNPNEWSYTGLQGAISFAHDDKQGVYYLRLVDMTGTRGVIWEHQLYEGFEYFSDRPYFHSFAGDVSFSLCC